MECLDQDTLAAFADGLLSEGELSRVEGHLDECTECLRLAAELARLGAQPGTEAEPALLRRGSTIGRYVIVGFVGAGGMGVVYSAYDPELERKVALKLLRASTVAPDRAAEASGRLLREAQVMARLSHPNVIAVHDVGAFGDQVFVAMELIDGLSLKRWLGKEPRSWRAVRDAFLEAGRGLAAAHSAGIVHRDFKPDNVLMGTDGRVRVTDFGLAGPAAAEEASAAQPDRGESVAGEALTRTGAFLGTPRYMAPEQLERRRVGAEADQFSFCVALYEALYGEAPFAGDTVGALRAEELGGRVRDAPKGSRVPARVRQALLRGLRAEPGARFPSMGALLAALAFSPTLTRRRGMALGAAALVLVAVAAGGLKLARRRSELCAGSAARFEQVWSPERQRGVREAFLATGKPFAADAWRGADRTIAALGSAWAAMRTEACEATRIRGEQSDEVLGLRMACLDARLKEVSALAELFEKADSQVVENAVRASHSLDDLSPCAETEALLSKVKPPANPVVRAEVERIRERSGHLKAKVTAGKFEAASQEGGQLAASARATGYRPLEGEVLFLLGSAQDGARDKAAAETLESAALASEAGRDDALAARAYLTLANILGRDRIRVDQVPLFLRQADICVERLGGDLELTALSEDVRSAAFHYDGRYADALPLALSAQEHFRQALGPEHPRVAKSLLYCALLLVMQAKNDEALAKAQEALQIQERTLGRDHPDVSSTLDRLADTHLAMGELAKAEELYRRSLDVRQRSLGPDHLLTARTQASLGDVLVSEERAAEALPLLETARATIRKTQGDEHPYLVSLEPILGRSLLKLGRSEEALAVFRHARDLAGKAFRKDHPLSLPALLGEGEALLALRSPVKALEPLERACAVQGAAQATREENGDCRFPLARALFESGEDRPRALRLAREAAAHCAEAGAPRRAERDRVEAWVAQHAPQKDGGEARP